MIRLNMTKPPVGGGNICFNERVMNKNSQHFV